MADQPEDPYTRQRKQFWVRWEVRSALMPQFEYHGPWWTSGYGSVSADSEDGEEETRICCAAVMAESDDAAKGVILGSFDTKEAASEVEFSFANERPVDESPYTDRFRRRDWMKWPWPEVRGG